MTPFLALCGGTLFACAALLIVLIHLSEALDNERPQE